MEAQNNYADNANVWQHYFLIALDLKFHMGKTIFLLFYSAHKLGKPLNSVFSIYTANLPQKRQTTLQNQFCIAPKIPVSYAFIYCEFWLPRILKKYWTKIKAQI